MPESQSSEAARERIARLLFAPDWKVAREVVTSDSWLLSPGADDELATVGAMFAERESADPELLPLAGAITVVRHRLGRAREVGVASAFDDLVALDEQFRAVANTAWLGDLHDALRRDPNLTSDLTVEALRLLLARTQEHDQPAAESLWNLYQVVVAVRRNGLELLERAAQEQIDTAAREAEQLLSPLRTLDLRHASPNDIQQCEHALALLARQQGSDLWHEALGRLGSLLLELREGDRAANVARARAAYRAILEAGPDERSAPWAAAVCGYANTLAADPDAAPAEFEQALAMLDALVGRLRLTDDTDTRVRALTCYVNALVAAPTGDPDERIERALELQREQIRVLGSASAHPELWGRAHNNLAGLFDGRRRGLRSQNVDEAVAALRVALDVRTRDADPIGRARVLRNLAQLLPEWSGADSQQAAEDMAAACLREAEDIARDDPRAAARPAEWAGFAGEDSALGRDLDGYLALPPAERVSRLEAAIAHHRDVIARLSRDRTPTQWATWKGGLGRLLAMLAHSRPDAVHEAYDHLSDAIDAAVSSRPRLRRDLHAALGSLGHQIGHWEISFPAYAIALELSDAFFDEAAAPDGRRRELADMRGFAMFAAYAAARLGRLDDAIALAERGRSRTLLEALAVAETVASSGSPERRAEISAASRRVVELERELAEVEAHDPVVVAETMRNRLADAIGAHPDLLKMRVTDPGRHAQSATQDYLRIVPELRTARAALRAALAEARTDAAETVGGRLDAGAIRRVAASVGYPVIYACATVYGGVAIVVPPDAEPQAILLDAFTSDVTRALAHGGEDAPGFVAAAFAEDSSALAAALPAILDVLRGEFVEPVAGWLTDHGFENAVLVPLGTLGLLPLHATLTGNTPAFAYAPSARALSLALAARARSSAVPSALLAVGSPTRDSTAPLPFATVEPHVVEHATTWARTTVLVASSATLHRVLPAAGTATHVLFACHGEFRPSDPMESALLLANEDRITLRMLLTGDVELSSARIAMLSACQTANVEFHSLPDEVLGLPSGFLLAGVPGVVGTMWPVDDRAAAFFTQQLCEELFVAKREPAAAVASAQRWLRDASAEELKARVKAMRAALADHFDDVADAELSRTWRELGRLDGQARPFAAPEYWAAFTYSGI